ncbi:hypothetical protein [Paenibacillus sp. IHBB 3054]|uniref:hypothetical protein n=1 Tax=Paenibacillus sp. IHBB 3054 TaxID=3425689 RepID=UPI003F670A00
MVNAIKKLLVGIVLLIGIVGVIGISGCGEKEVVLKDRIEISTEFRNELNTLLENKDYDALAIATVRDMNNNTELNAMYYFAQTMDAFYNDGNMMNYYFEQIPLEYKEHYGKLLKEEQKEYIASLQEELDAEKTKYKDKPPVIGETKEQLKTSSWGLPYDINKTTTGDNVSEQWVYDDGKYVYLDDGIVTAIQE